MAKHPGAELVRSNTKTTSVERLDHRVEGGYPKLDRKPIRLFDSFSLGKFAIVDRGPDGQILCMHAHDETCLEPYPGVAGSRGKAPLSAELGCTHRPARGPAPPSIGVATGVARARGAPFRRLSPGVPADYCHHACAHGRRDARGDNRRRWSTLGQR